jgi:hypothetical protein
MFMALGVDLAGVTALGRARTTEQARRSLEGYRLNGVLWPLSLLLLLVPGIYMAVQWVWVPWIRVAFSTLLLIVALGAIVTRRRLSVIGQALGGDDRRLDPNLEGRIRDPLLRTSFVLRAFLSAGIVALMTTKPSLTTSLLVIGTALVAAGLFSTPFWLSSRRIAR